jgi:putative toxin-antitoxin system antitoxin component (TIGR02293 family)
VPPGIWHNVDMSTLHAHIGEWLGVPLPHSERDVLEMVEHRLPTSAVDRLLALGFTKAEIDELIIPLRTLQHRKAKRERLTVEESDKVLRIIRALSTTEDVYDSRERSLSWLRRENPRLSNRAPLSLVGTYTGSRMVEELLGQIDEGMFV